MAASGPISRREMLAFGGAVAGGLGTVALLPGAASAATAPATPAVTPAAPIPASRHPLPVGAIERIMRAQGTVSDGVLTIEIDRDDLHVVGPGGIPFKPSWEMNGSFNFQSLGRNWAITNCDFAFLPNEIQPAIDAMLRHGLQLQAEHQHFYDLDPQVWFMHFRAQGHPLQLAAACAAVVEVTATPLPQKPPAHPTTPLDPDELASILHGTATVGADGVVMVSVPRRDQIVLDGVAIKPELNVTTTIGFEPLPGPHHTAVAPDFAMIATEIESVVRVMRHNGWAVHCLYNQETDEQPQLYFSHQLKVGDAVTLAREVRRGLDRTNSV